MKYFNKITLITLTIITGLSLNNMANAVVTIDVEKYVKVTAINGQAVNRKLLQNPERQFTLQPGNHVITAKYNRLYNLKKDEHDYLRSGNITISAQLDDNQTYQLVMPKQPEAYREAKVFVKSPTLALMNGSQVITSQSIQNSSKNGILSGLGNKVGGWFGGSAVNENAQAIAAINSNTASAPTSSPTNNSSTNNSPTQTASVSNTATTLDQFMQLWLQATPAERQRIRSWVTNK